MQTSPRQNERGTIAEIVAHSWQYWRAKRGHLAELEYTGPDEMERMARELGLTTSDLGALAAKGTVDAADLLPRRMASLHLDVAELSRAPRSCCGRCRGFARCVKANGDVRAILRVAPIHRHGIPIVRTTARCARSRHKRSESRIMPNPCPTSCPFPKQLNLPVRTSGVCKPCCWGCCFSAVRG